MGALDDFLDVPTPDQSAQKVISAFARAGKTREVIYVVGEFRLLIGEQGKQPSAVYLQSAYGEHCRRSHADRERHLRETVGEWLSDS